MLAGSIARESAAWELLAQVAEQLTNSRFFLPRPPAWPSSPLLCTPPCFHFHSAPPHTHTSRCHLTCLFSLSPSLRSPPTRGTPLDAHRPVSRESGSVGHLRLTLQRERPVAPAHCSQDCHLAPHMIRFYSGCLRTPSCYFKPNEGKISRREVYPAGNNENQTHSVSESESPSECLLLIVQAVFFPFSTRRK